MEALFDQTSGTDSTEETQWECCKCEDPPMLEFRCFPIFFKDGVEPRRLRAILDLLAAVTQLVDVSIWNENRRKLGEVPPY